VSLIDGSAPSSHNNKIFDILRTLGKGADNSPTGRAKTIKTDTCIRTHILTVVVEKTVVRRRNTPGKPFDAVAGIESTLILLTI